MAFEAFKMFIDNLTDGYGTNATAAVERTPPTPQEQQQAYDSRHSGSGGRSVFGQFADNLSSTREYFASMAQGFGDWVTMQPGFAFAVDPQQRDELARAIGDGTFEAVQQAPSTVSRVFGGIGSVAGDFGATVRRTQWIVGGLLLFVAVAWGWSQVKGVFR